MLKHNGTLIFKWSEVEIKIDDILSLFTETPVIKQNTANKSHFCVFFKTFKISEYLF